MKRGGGFDFDEDILKEQRKNISKLNAKDEPFVDPFAQKESQEESKSLKDMLKEKREASEKVVDASKHSNVESVEERRQRLKAQRDLLI